MQFNEYRIKINIVLSPGIYLFDNQSALGKTWLFNEMRKHQCEHEDIFTFTYNDLLLHHKFEIGDGIKICILDRYDMYEGLFVNEIVEASSNCVILVDSKALFSFTDNDKFCYITLTDGRIEVTE